jgi:hypothetical protein
VAYKTAYFGEVGSSLKMFQHGTGGWYKLSFRRHWDTETLSLGDRSRKSMEKCCRTTRLSVLTFSWRSWWHGVTFLWSVWESDGTRHAARSMWVLLIKLSQLFLTRGRVTHLASRVDHWWALMDAVSN